MNPILPLLVVLVGALTASAWGQSDVSAPSAKATVADVQDGMAAVAVCELAEDCYRAATGPDPLAVSAEEGRRWKLERLQLAEERESKSVWGQRASLLTAMLSIETAPADALRRFQSAAQDFAVIEDYIRFWTGEALVSMGQLAEAAAMFESIPTGVPETILSTRAAFRSGEVWYRASQCANAIDPLTRAIGVAPQDPFAPMAFFMLADCLGREGRLPESLEAFKQLWMKYPHAPEARDAAIRLSLLSGDRWRPTPEEVLTRALAFLSLALHAEAVEELHRFLALAPQHPKRDEATFKLGTALVRLRRYDQAREVYRGLVSAQAPQAGEAAVWLARIYLRQDAGDRLLALPASLPPPILSPDQKAAILLFRGVWLDDHGRHDEAISTYRQAATSSSAAGQRMEAWWRMGWVQYRQARYRAALEAFRNILNAPEDFQWTPQALYWTARIQARLADAKAEETYATLCRRYLLNYYCQLAQRFVNVATPVSTLVPDSVRASPNDQLPDLKKDRHYKKAVELKWLGRDREAARELAALAERYAKDRAVVMELCGLLTEVGEHHLALRLARRYFRDAIERGPADKTPGGLWSAAYPTAHLPLIRLHAGQSLDPLLAAAIIREESHYDPRALSQVGAVGLMQLMLGTAQGLQKKGAGVLVREDLFDQETNIRFGVKYLDQLLEQFSGNLIYTVAAYNAGPQAVSTWIQRAGSKEADEFVEMIPYLETRQYVKRVLRSYREYQRLAASTCPLPSLDKAC